MAGRMKACVVVGAWLWALGVARAEDRDEPTEFSADGGPRPSGMELDCASLRARILRIDAAARNKPKADAQMMAVRRVECLRLALPGGGQSSAIAGQLLQTLGEIVVHRATRAAWRLLSSKLREVAGCDAKDDARFRFAKVCQVTETLRIQDLVASPEILLHAVVGDLMLMVQKEMPDLPGVGCFTVGDGTSTSVCLEEMLENAALAWVDGGIDTALASLRGDVLKKLRDVAASETCPGDLGAAALWVTAQCVLVDQQINRLASCASERFVQSCEVAKPRRLERLLPLVAGAISDKNGAATARLVFAVAREAVDAEDACARPEKLDGQIRDRCALIQGLETTYSGVAERDWTAAAGGASALAQALLAIAKVHVDRKLFAFLAAIGQYATTYRSGQDAAAASAARRGIIEELLASLVSRSDRNSGAVISVGGAFAVYGGARTDAEDHWQAAFPMQLGFGFGLQTYGADTHGFHLMVSLLDISQYVSYEDGDFDVSEPEVESSIAFGSTVGVWFGDRETPVFLGANFTFAPFVRYEDEPTFTFGAVFGAYVPFFDFN